MRVPPAFYKAEMRDRGGKNILFPARMLVLDVFDRSLLLQLAVAQTMFQGTILSPGELFFKVVRCA
jgi:hypothetical protein